MSNVFFRNPDIYGKYRPEPPKELIHQILTMLGGPALDTLVDLGCSTGNSTRVWAPYAKRVIGVEPSVKLCDYARAHTAEPNVEFKVGYGHDTGLLDSCADMVCAASSIHWMDPVPTIPEIHRVLKPRGLFCHFGPVKPPVSPYMELDAEFQEFFAAAKAIQDNSTPYVEGGERHRWDGLVNSTMLRDKFPVYRLFYMHQYMAWSASHYKGWVRSLGMIDKLIKVQDQALISLMDHFFERVDHFMTDRQKNVFFVYKVFVLKRDAQQGSTPHDHGS